jgi:hypothetical protein
MTELLTQLGAFGLVVAAVAWLVKKLVAHWLDRDVEAYKARLTSEQALQVERLRAALAREAAEHEIRFRSLQEKQAEVVAETYARLQKLYAATARYTSIFGTTADPSHEEMLKDVSAAHEEFAEYFYPRQIYLPSLTRARLRGVVKALVKAVHTMTRHVRDGEKRARVAERRGGEPRDLWGEAFDQFNNKVEPLFQRLEDDFQGLLGVAPTHGDTDGQEAQEEAQEGRQPQA